MHARELMLKLLAYPADLENPNSADEHADDVLPLPQARGPLPCGCRPRVTNACVTSAYQGLAMRKYSRRGVRRARDLFPLPSVAPSFLASPSFYAHASLSPAPLILSLCTFLPVTLSTLPSLPLPALSLLPMA